MSRYSVAYQPDSGRIEARGFSSDRSALTSVVKEDVTNDVLTAAAQWLALQPGPIAFRNTDNNLVYVLTARIIEQ